MASKLTTISLRKKICIFGLIFFQSISYVYAVELKNLSCTTCKCGIISTSHYSDKYPKANPVLERKGYTLAHDGRTKTALWVYEELTKDSCSGNIDRSQFRFMQDPDIPKIIQSDLVDYLRSGFDRGHLAAAGNHKSIKISMKETFYLSNISAQVPRFNRGYWKKFENYIRSLTNEYDMIRVVTGPLYLSYEGPDGKRYVTYQVIGPNEVAVPPHFFKVITLEKGSFQEQRAYVIPNEKIDQEIPFSDFQTTVSKVEKISGIIFQKFSEQ
ncbi:MAG: DNA/RNA non-specific endonuclease [Chlamydiales bacterium]